MSNMSDVVLKGNGQAPDFKKKTQSLEAPIERIAQQAGHAVGEMTSKIADKTTEYVQSSREYIQENPVRSVAIAAAAGAIIGSMATLAMHRRR